ncbi:C69 family dipeptidase [Bifidobacterium pullorum subsp. saeculare]|uniref:Dipeptidase n=1 Tax=Bifidobacterium pullorum subsp. saeculare TaxID=78257 RepID=A0A938WX42_9BIFI|nr:C69 family dipeptidase [Bifidobacterium pullorum]MBM6699180.1 C69 family dipeptidase [Bifidobacterium pullorum subsp. saeculare]
MPCTTILVGRNASYDGSTLVARNDDSGSGRYDPKRFVAVNPADQPRHYRAEISHIEIDLPDDPCRYAIVPNALPGRGVLAEAGANIHNVAMSATETIAVNERVLGADPMVELMPAVGTPGEPGYRPEAPGGIGEEDFISLVLPYVATAREGVLRLGALLEEHGTYEANGIAISDADEIWYVETIGGHHWIARRVPDDCYAAIPNQLGLDDFDLDDALGEGREHLCSADLREFIRDFDLDVTMDAAGPGFGAAPAGEGPRRFNPRALFGTRTEKDHIYNTPRAWYMHRYLNPSEDWDSPQAAYHPESDDLPWCRRPERKVSIEDIDALMSSHFEGTSYDPYGRKGDERTRRMYRPIGINRTGHLVALQVRGRVPEPLRSVMWIAYGSQPHTALAPFYANVTGTPEYLSNTGAEVSTESLYWTNRIVAALADAHHTDNSNAIEHYREDVLAHGHAHMHATDRAVAADAAGSGAAAMDATAPALERANEAMASWLKARTSKLLGEVLYTTSNLMRNAFRMSDR